MTTRKGRGQGFASMSSEQKREIAAKGGKAAHALGTAHTWTSSEARRAGSLGGRMSRRGLRMSDEERAAARALVLAGLAAQEALSEEGQR